jgi:hypothetical protein
MSFLVTNKLSFVGFEVLTAVVMKSTIFWDMTSCRPLKVNWRFGGTYRLHLESGISRVGSPPAFPLVFCSAYSPLKMEAICSSATSVDFQRARRRYIPEDRVLHTLCYRFRGFRGNDFSRYCLLGCLPALITGPVSLSSFCPVDVFLMPSYITLPILHVTGFDSEYRGSMFLRNASIHLQD